MKKHFIFALALAIAIVVFAFTAQAQNTDANGTTIVNIGNTTGNQKNGTTVFGTGTAGGEAADPTNAQVSAEAAAAGTGTQTVHPTNSTVKANTGESLGVTLTGTHTEAALGGTTTQLNNALTGDGSNTFSSGGSTSGATEQINGTAAAPITSTIGLDTSGQTHVNATGDGTNHANASICTAANSQADGMFTTADPNATQEDSSGVSGEAVAGLQATAGDPKSKTYAQAGAMGVGDYNLTTTNLMSMGNTQISAQSSGTIGPNGVSASSAMTITAAVKTTP